MKFLTPAERDVEAKPPEFLLDLFDGGSCAVLPTKRCLDVTAQLVDEAVPAVLD